MKQIEGEITAQVSLHCPKLMEVGPRTMTGRVPVTVTTAVVPEKEVALEVEVISVEPPVRT